MNVPLGKAKSWAISISVAFIWILNFINTKCYFLILDLIQYRGLFLANGVCCIFASLTVFFTLPETKNKTLAQVQLAFNQLAWKT